MRARPSRRPRCRGGEDVAQGAIDHLSDLKTRLEQSRERINHTAGRAEEDADRPASGGRLSDFPTTGTERVQNAVPPGTHQPEPGR
jgi:hypothetical protein